MTTSLKQHITQSFKTALLFYVVTALMGFVYGIFSGYIYDISLVAIGFLSSFILINFILSILIALLASIGSLIFTSNHFPKRYTIYSFVFFIYALVFFGVVKIFELELF